MLTVADLVAVLGINPARPVDEAWAAAVVDGVNDYVDHLPHVTPGAWDRRTLTGASMLAQTAYEARGGANGAAALDLVAAADAADTKWPQFSRYLRIGRHTKPRAG
jgi:hypothetical protein